MLTKSTPKPALLQEGQKLVQKPGVVFWSQKGNKGVRIWKPQNSTSLFRVVDEDQVSVLVEEFK